MPKSLTKKVLDIVDIIPISKKLNSALLLKEGKYPVYSSEIFNSGVKGYTNNPSFNKNNETYIIFGDHTRSINIVCCPFSVMDNVKVLKIKKGLLINELYLKYLWQNKIPNLGYSRHWKVAKNVKISIPTKDGKIFDIEKQKEIALKYKEIEKQKQILIDKIEYLKKTSIDDNNSNYKYKEISINELFTPKGGNMLLSKEFCKINEGKYPVYSGSTSSDIFANLNAYDYDGQYLTWVIDGLAGYMKIVDGKFSITCHRGILLPTEKCKNIDLLYVKYVLEPVFRERKRGRMGINGKNEYTALKPTHIKKYNDKIKIPIDENGNFDIKKQREIAQKIATIESIKSDLYNKVIELTNITVI